LITVNFVLKTQGDELYPDREMKKTQRRLVERKTTLYYNNPGFWFLCGHRKYGVGTAKRTRWVKLRKKKEPRRITRSTLRGRNLKKSFVRMNFPTEKWSETKEKGRDSQMRKGES